MAVKRGPVTESLSLVPWLLNCKVCLCWLQLIISGFVIRGLAALYKQREWDRMTKELNELQKLEGSQRPKFSSRGQCYKTFTSVI